MKKIFAFFLMLALGLCTFSCTKQEGAPSPSPDDSAPENGAETESEVDRSALVYDYDLSPYITLPDYMGMKLKKSEVTASEEQIQARLKADFLGKDVSRAVQTGDTAVIDFIGKRDGVAFQGGTGYDYELKIGSGSFIDGFEEGLIGVMPGETVDLNLSFPSDYHNESLRGVAVVFTVTVNYIKTDSLELPALTDEAVRILTNFETVAEYNEEMPKELSSILLENAVQTYLFENAVIHSYPEDALSAHRNSYVRDITAILAPYGLEPDENGLAQLGMTPESFEKKADEYAKTAVHSDLVLYAVAREQNIMPTEEQRKQALEEIFLEYQKEFSIANMDSLIELLGDDADKLILQRVIIDHLCANAVLED